MPLDDIPSYISGPVLLAALASLGLFIGILTGLFGIGGGFLIVPLLNILFGIPYSLAVGSSLSFTIGTSTAGILSHRRQGNVDLRTVLSLSAGSMVGAVLGDAIHQYLKTRVAVNEGQFQTIMDGIFVVMLLVAAWLVFLGPREHADGRSFLQRLPLPPRIDLPGVKLSGVSLPGLSGVGLAIGILIGLLGIGGGVLFMPVLLMVGLTAHQAVGTSLGIVVLASVVATVKKGLGGGQISLIVAMALIVGSVVGVQIGAWLCGRMHDRNLRRYFAMLVGLVALTVGLRLIIALVP